MGIESVKKPKTRPELTWGYKPSFMQSQESINIRINKPTLLLQGHPHITDEISLNYQDLFKVPQTFVNKRMEYDFDGLSQAFHYQIVDDDPDLISHKYGPESRYETTGISDRPGISSLEANYKLQNDEIYD